MLVKNMILKYILLTLLIILSLAHIQKIIFLGIGVNQVSLPIFFLMGIALLKEKRKLYSISFILMGTVNILFLNGSDTLGAIPVFLIAMIYCSDKYTIISIISLIPTAFVLNAYIFGREDFQNIPLSILGNYGFLLFFYFAVIKQPENIEKLSKITPLTKRQLLILKYLAMDIPRKQIPDKVKDSTLWRLGLERDKFTLDIINSEIAKIKKILNIVNGEALGVWYNKHVEILSEKKLKKEV